MRCPNCGADTHDVGGRCSACRSELAATVLAGVLTPVPGDQTVYPEARSAPAPDSDATFPGDTTGLPPSAGGVRQTHVPRTSTGPLEISQQFGARYLIVRLLGIGGMGAVYQAWDAELSVMVALKVVRPEVTADPDAAREIERRFKQELLLARQVTHRNVVRIHDLGEINGIKYITMPYVEGEDLSSVLKQAGKLAVSSVMPIARQIAAGLRAAHDAGIVHRDLKPANVMIEKDAEAIIMDFGIARTSSRTGASVPGSGTLGQLDTALDGAVTRASGTMAGAVVGTIEYMAPEQARGQEVDQRADIYAFGLMIYDMLVGRRRAERAVSAIGELQKRLEESLPHVKSLVPEVPDALDRLVSRCIEPDAAKRYQTTAELVAALDRLTDAGTLRPIRKVVGLPIAAAAAILLLGTSAGLWWYQRQFIPPPVHDPVSVVLADVQNNTGDATLDHTLEPVLKLALEGASFISVYDRSGIRSRLGVPAPEKLDERAAQEIAVRQGVGVVLSGAISREGGGYGLSVRAVRAATGEVIADASDRTPDKGRVLSVASELASEVRAALGDDTSDDMQRFAMATWTASSLEVVHDFALATVALSNLDYENARKLLLSAVERDPNFGPGYASLAAVSLGLGRRQDAENYAEEAIRHIDRMTERERLTARGLLYVVKGDYQACAKEYDDMIARFAQDSVAHNNLALCSLRLRDTAKAVAHMQQVVKILPKRALYRVNLSLYSAYAGDFQTAEQEAQVAQELKNRFSWQILAFSHLGQGLLPRVAQEYQELAKVDALGLSLSASGLGDLAAYEGRFGEAARIFEQGAATDLAAKAPEQAADKLVALAQAHLARGQERQAVAAADRALVQNGGAVKIRFLAGRVFVEAGQTDKAQTLIAQLAKERLVEPRAYAKLLEGEMLLKDAQPGRAINLFTEANALLDTWIGRFDLGRAYLEDGAFAQADSEFDRCLKRRGEAISLFLDQDPTYGFLPPVYYYQGRAREGMKTNGFADSYRAYLNIRGKSTEDRLVSDARQRAGS